MSTLLPVFYLPPISWFSVFLQGDSEIIFEQFESFPKQTYRNRTVIYGANGALSLIIPINHNGTRTYKDVEISYRDKWSHLHWKSIKTAYQTSAYFEYYEDTLAEIFTTKKKNLFDFNLHALEIIQKLLKTEQRFSFSSEYFKEPSALDLRTGFSAKDKESKEMEVYFQNFSDKYGFQENLSIIDLLCNKGPESLTYIKSIQIK
ncbi:WbqC family protein [Chryseobacterium sp. MP_3.2]|uniref:WbqC family protein n=1 Tax=Chryseobacterium sp. MP_3.2 TaxID=3071712 RepID=UPI002DFCFAFD|nr:hypothetical protein [Chryseobacterium sp. MP_3.2]